MIVLIVVLLIISILITIASMLLDFIKHIELRLKYKIKFIEIFFLLTEIIALGVIVYIFT